MYRELEERLSLCAGSIERLISSGLSGQYGRICLKRKRVIARRNLEIVKRRVVFEPAPELKAIQRRIAKFIEASFTAHPIAHAYAKNRSILSNAKWHDGAKAMAHLDLLNFFGSIGQDAVAKALRRLFPNLPASETEVMAELCCRAGRLPQGSPASPILSNLVCFLFDIELAAFAQSVECEVSRYSDDISFSAPDPQFIRRLAWYSRGGICLVHPLRELIARHGFSINWKKVRLETQRTGLKVTGLIVGASAVSIPRAFRDSLRASLNRWEREGLPNSSGNNRSERSADQFVRSMRGRIAYVGQIVGEDSNQYRRLLNTFDRLYDRCRG